ncbi:hypothetical protein ACFQ3W_09440 [Paenibacillus puldeungensis]|uniref:YobI-like P-loop NTPase domain-containing protein n=1 Tax=Paenibacillus puldeungensis TaxID=696536 RepID=A0ABW3RWL1_9BACL
MSERKQIFQKLTPIRNAEIGIYSEAMEFVFENRDLRNVAISGAYSAGKSSVIESYKELHPDKKFIHISLAHFQSAEETAATVDSATNSAPKPETIKESILEGKILNQLIHQISPNRIPQTNFKVKQKVVRKKLVWWVIASIFFILSFLHLFFFSGWKSYANNVSPAWIKTILRLTAENSSPLVSGVICVALAAILLYHIINLQINKGVFKKISANKFTIEIFEGSDDSYFDKYLNEVLYLFDQCAADVIVFEDMDRYNANRIFERLREVNYLVNVQRSKEVDVKPLRFFYLLRDDIFISKDRTKFFDFIIPIVPVVASSNSYDKFIEHLSDNGVLGLFDESFLRGLSLYIDDMRLLKNICNEFSIYDNRLNITELKPDKLMAIIAYKNLFPRDFSELQLGRGFVFTLFDKKEQFIAAKIIQLEAELAAARARLEATKNEHLTSVHELDLVFQEKRSMLSNYSYQQRQTQSQQIETEYTNRKEALENRSAGRQPALEDDITRLESKIARVKNEALQDIITRENIDELFAVTSKNNIGVISDFSDIRGNDYFDLLKYLIRNGYIDEFYADYMTYFYEHSLSRTDKIFLRSVSDQVKKEPVYQLKEPQKILIHLKVSHFDQPEVLNYDLLFFLLQKFAVNETTIPYLTATPTFPTIEAGITKEQQCLMAMVQQILSTKDYFFLQSVFIDIQDEKLNLLVNFLNSARKDCLTNILIRKTDFAGGCRDDFVFRTLIITPDRDLTNDDEFTNALSAFVSNHPFIFDRASVEENRLKAMFGEDVRKNLLIVSLIERFKLLKIRFCSIDYQTTDTKLFDEVYSNNLYKLSFSNIAHLLKVKYDLTESDDLKYKNYTLISARPDSPLAVYVESEIDCYIEEVLMHCDKRIEDDETAAKAILNNDEISTENKTAYISVLKTEIQALSDVEEESLWKQLITSNLVTHTEENIINYFVQCGNSLTDDLVQFIDADEQTYNFSKVRNQYDKETQRAFFKAIVRCDSLSDAHYEQFLATLEWHYKNGFDVEDISGKKMDILVDNNVIRMGEANLTFIRATYPDNLIQYIIVNIEEYCDLIVASELFNSDEAIELLVEHISDEFKLRLIENIEDEFTAINSAYTDAVKSYIILNKFRKEDLPYFVSHYKTEGEKTKAAIISKTMDWLETPLTEPLPISRELFEDIISSDRSMTSEEKSTLFWCLLPTLDKAQCKHYLSQLGLDDDFLSLFEQKRPKILINDTNKRILEEFQSKYWITKFEVDDRDGNYYRAYGRRVLTGPEKDDVMD